MASVGVGVTLDRYEPVDVDTLVDGELGVNLPGLARSGVLTRLLGNAVDGV